MYEPDTQLRDFENISLTNEIVDYFCREVEPHVNDAWADGDKIRSAYEINFNRHFYKYIPPRPLAEIDADIKRMEEEFMRLLREVTL
jgi:type I restriction enzyme M protein